MYAEVARPTPSSFRQWWVLTLRMVTPTLRNGEVLTLIAASTMFTVGFYVPLKQIMGAFIEGMSSYAQYLMPLIALNGIAFAGFSAGFRSATDAVQGVNGRFKAMPIARLTPLASRMSASMFRCSVALMVALVCGHIIGFRFHGTAAHTAGFCLLALLIGAVMSLIGDLIGAATENPEATIPLMLLPVMIFGQLSVGLQPVERFPEWIQSFIENQPISQFVYGLRALAGDSTAAAGDVTWSVIGPPLAWLAGLFLVVMPMHALVAFRRR